MRNLTGEEKARIAKENSKIQNDNGTLIFTKNAPYKIDSNAYATETSYVSKVTKGMRALAKEAVEKLLKKQGLKATNFKFFDYYSRDAAPDFEILVATQDPLPAMGGAEVVALSVWVEG